MQREQLSIPKMALYLIYAVIFYAVQSSLFGAWSFRGFHLDLLPAFVAAAALLDGPAEGAVVGIVIGLLYDVSMSGPDGLYPLFFLAFGLLAGALSSLSLSRNYISMLMLNAGEMLVLDLLRYFCYLLPQKGASFLLVLQQTVGGILMASVLCFIVYVPMRIVSRAFTAS